MISTLQTPGDYVSWFYYPWMLSDSPFSFLHYLLEIQDVHK